MALERKSTAKLDSAWKWWLRALASAITVTLLLTDLNAPAGLYLLLLGLFFGPEILKGQIAINRRAKDEE